MYFGLKIIPIFLGKHEGHEAGYKWSMKFMVGLDLNLKLHDVSWLYGNSSKLSRVAAGLWSVLRCKGGV